MEPISRAPLQIKKKGIHVKCRYVFDSELMKFYNSKRWKRARDYIRAKFHGMCQQCKGVGREVHHIVALDKHNMHTDLAVSENNLVLLCTRCHNNQREKKETRKDVMFTADGDLVSVPPTTFTKNKGF